MLRLAFLCTLALIAACTFDQGGIPADDDAGNSDIDGSVCVPTGAETCNGNDDDCDGTVDEDFPTKGDPCDGSDGDQCTDGIFVCNQAGNGVECNDEPGALVETCDGTDDDCDGQTDEGFHVGEACDGPDTDLCAVNEGVFQCDGNGAAECTDTTGNSIEVCDDVNDEDCDGFVDEDWNKQNDESNCGTCGTVCQAVNGTNDCVLGTCTPVCDNGARDCNGNRNDGCELVLNTNPVCSTGVQSLGMIRGDDGPGGQTIVGDTGTGEAWYSVTITENDPQNTGGPVEADIFLDVPAGMDYDLWVYCDSCGGTLAASSGNDEGVNELVHVQQDDQNNTSNSFTVIIEIEFFSANACGDWILTVTGSTGTGTENC